ncbi:MBG domain-containing protein [Dyella sp. C9]|uniref:two-partner secretion domain-containing protein n=1 Tax=Dyella sp. C9 TaxID=2202154 RepID=UPI000DEFFC2E|nr:MBG domain-containing protein [Dyella sp. C9]
MNRTYRLVWNPTRQLWVIASELATRRTKAGRVPRHAVPRPSRLAWLCLWLPAAMLFTVVDTARAGEPPANTLPAGGQVTSGSGRITQSSNTTTISQQSQHLSLSWQSFNVGAAATVDFQQPNASSIAVNRIADVNGSQIYGHLDANGQVYLINPYGVLFGPGAQVNAGGLVASTLNVADAALNSNTMSFSGSGAGKVVNQGQLAAAPGGYVALLAGQVSNQGVIRAQLGTVVLAGGSAATLSFSGDQLVGVQVDQGALDALAENRNLIVADGGRVVMTAGAQDSLLASAVNNTGSVEAQTVQDHAGSISLLGGAQAGTVNVDGTLDASAPAGGNGGHIETSASQVSVANDAVITSKATYGQNGSWLIDPQDFTIAASGGDITGKTLSSELGSNNVTIESSSGSVSGSGNINVNDAVGWNTNTLTITAANNININAVMTAGGNAGLVMNTATANGTDTGVAGGTVNVALGSGRVDFTGSANSLAINGNPYTIITNLGAPGSTTGTDVQGINGNLSGDYALGADIDASATSGWNSGAGFAPLGTSASPFMGVFDGLGHTITHLTIDRPSAIAVGLFGWIGSNADVRNLGLIGGTVTGEGDVGDLAGANAGYISNSYASGEVTGDGGSIGGLVGYDDGWINDAHANGAVADVSGSGSVGGLAGINEGSLSNVYATGPVAGGGIDGGLVGYNLFVGSISNAYATGAVSGSYSVGGLVGMNEAAITDAYATGAVNGSPNSDYVGGLVGSNYSGGTISNAYATGTVGGDGTIGGFVGYNSGTISNAYWNEDRSGTATGVAAGTSTGVTGLSGSGSSPYAASSYQGFNFTTTPGAQGNAWVMVDSDGTLNGSNGGTLPMLASEYATTITNAHQLQLMAMNPAGSYVLGGNIDASATGTGNDVWGSGGFVPIGTSYNNLVTATGTAYPASATTPFTGTFNGLGHTINGLTINDLTTNAGLFGQVGDGGGNGLVTDVGLVGGTVSGGAQNEVGALAGDNEGTISNAYATTTVSDPNAMGVELAGNSGLNIPSIGGLVGYNGGSLTQVYATGAVSGAYNLFLGGLVGYNAGSINNAFATGAVTSAAPSSLTSPSQGAVYAGGLTGFNGGTIASAYASGAVSTTGLEADAGGFAGGNDGSISNAYATGAVSTDQSSFGVGGFIGYNMAGGSIADAYSLGSASGSGGAYVGAFAGHNEGSLTGVYWDTSTSGSTTGIGLGSSTGAIGLATPQWLTEGPVATGAFDTSNTWVAGYPYPVLKALPYVLVTASGSQTYGSSAQSIGITGVTDQDGNDASALVNTSGINWLTTASASSNAGGYVIGGEGATVAPDYQLTYVGALVVDPASLVITANNASKTYNGLAYSGGNGVTYSGFVNGDGTSVLSGSLAYGGTAQGAVNAGSYSIAPEGLSAANYIITYDDGTLTVNPAVLAAGLTGTVSKVYDGTSTATLAAGNYTLSGIIGGDQVSLDDPAAGSYASANVGSKLEVTVNGLALIGASAGNYVLASNSANADIGTITPASLVITASNQSKTYGQTLSLGSTAFSESGLVGNDSVSGVTLASAGAPASANVARSPYTIAASQAVGTGLSNYVITYMPGLLYVDPAPLTVTANSTSETYNGRAYAGGHGVSYSGFVNGQNASVLGGRLQYAGTAQGATNVGTYSIAPEGLTAANYAITYVDGTLTVNPATLTYIANRLSLPDGETPTGMSGRVVGFVDGQNLADATSGTLVWTTSATSGSLAGSYAIDGSGLTAQNYVFVQSPGNATALTLRPVRTGRGAVASAEAAPLSGGTLLDDAQSASSGGSTAGALPSKASVRVVGQGVALP